MCLPSRPVEEKYMYVPSRSVVISLMTVPSRHQKKTLYICTYFIASSPELGTETHKLRFHTKLRKYTL